MADKQTLLDGTVETENLPAPVAHTPMQLIETLVANGGDVEKLERLMALQERWERNESVRDYHAALAAFQSECPIVHKGREAAFGGKHVYSYASLDDIMRAIRPSLDKHGLTIKFSAKIDGGMMTVECTIRKGIHCEVSSTTLPVPSDMRVNETQKMAAALSYAKRYALCAALNIVVSDEDTDGGGMVKTVDQAQFAALDDLFSQLPQTRRDKFLAIYGWGDLSEVPAARFDEIRDVLARGLSK